MQKEYIDLGDVLKHMYRPENFRETRDDPEDFCCSDEVKEESAFTVSAYPPTDIGIDLNENLFIECAVPGHTSDTIGVTRDGNRLIITGTAVGEDIVQEYVQQEMQYSDFRRVVVMDETYSYGSVIASVEHGILTVMIPPSAKRAAEEIQVH